MWVSKKRWETVNKRIAELEEKVQNYQIVLAKHVEEHERENEELKVILASLKGELLKALGVV